MPIEKRRHPRSQIIWPVTLIGLHGFASGVTRNLSLAGTLVYCSEMPDADENLSLVLKPNEHQNISAAAEMVWFNTHNSNNHKMHAMGVCFTHIPHPGRQLLSAMVCNQLKLEYIKQFFAKRLRLWGPTILNKMKLSKFKCHICKTDLLLGPTEKLCPVCENLLPKSLDLDKNHIFGQSHSPLSTATQSLVTSSRQ